MALYYGDKRIDQQSDVILTEKNTNKKYKLVVIDGELKLEAVVETTETETPEVTE